MENPNPSRWRAIGPALRSPLGAPLILAAAVFAACLVGIYARPVGFLATVWPANAVMLGLLIRVPATARPLGWVAAAIAYLAADMCTGSDLLKAVLLNSGNLASVGTAYFIYTRLPAGMARLRHPSSMLYLVLAAAAGGGVAGVIGGIAGEILFGDAFISGWALWCATEFANYLAILPVILSWPRLRALMSAQARPFARLGARRVLPIVSLIVSCLGAIVIGGPGAIAFPVPALLWCGLTYSIFETALLTLLFGIWTLVIIASGYLPGAVQAGDEMALISIRLGVSLIAVAPVMLASVMQSRNTLLAKMRHLATHDHLTGTNSRNAFKAKAAQVLASGPRSVAVMMLDLDHFKTVNDRFGHAGGDEVLVAFAQRVRRCLRASDLLGRLGGEEFAVLVVDCPQAQAFQIAERIRLAVAGSPVALRDGRSVPVSASIGLVVVDTAERAYIDPLLAEADALLYSAKAKGRDRVETQTRATPTPHIEPAALPRPAAAASLVT